MTWLRVTLPYAVFAVVVDDSRNVNRIVNAAPIARWAIGKSRAELESWVRGERGTVEVVL